MLFHYFFLYFCTFNHFDEVFDRTSDFFRTTEGLTLLHLLSFSDAVHSYYFNVGNSTFVQYRLDTVCVLSSLDRYFSIISTRYFCVYTYNRTSDSVSFLFNDRQSSTGKLPHLRFFKRIYERRELVFVISYSPPYSFSLARIQVSTNGRYDLFCSILNLEQDYAVNFFRLNITYSHRHRLIVRF